MTALPSATRSTTFPAPPAPTIVHARPTRAGYAWAAVIALLGLVVGVTWGVTTVLGMQRQIDGFDRAAIPGETRVRVTETGGRVLYYEGLGEMPLVALGVRVLAPSGDAVRVGTYGSDLRYDAPGGIVGHAVGTFDATVPGIYRVEARGAAPFGATLAVGETIPASTFAGIVGAVLLVLVAGATALGFVVVTAIRRH